jgi:radical SAM superfamily enzyme YgiQ (UPF0313 family)
MRIMLFNTLFEDIYGYERMFPLGLGYLAAVLIQKGYLVSLIEPQLDNISKSELETLVLKESPDIVGITAVTPTFPEAVKIAKVIKNINKRIKIVIGGVHASCLPEQILNEYPEFDFVVIGEGEYTVVELCDQLMQGGNNWGDIKGLCYRENGNVMRTNHRAYIKDMDSIPMPARDLVDLNKYRLPLHIDNGKMSASMITSRGCPARCTFCSSKITMGNAFRFHSPDYVVKEIEYLISRYRIEHIQFVDDTFTVSSERVKKICEDIIRRNIRFEWHCFARVETVSEDLLSLMKKAGCSSILFGIESGDKSVLKNIKKGINLEKAKEVHNICREIGINILSSFIIGNPGETTQTINKTIDFAKELKPTFAMFYRLVPYPGSQVYEKYMVSGNMRQDLGWKSFAPKGIDMVFSHENLSKRELDLFIAEAYRKFYLNPINIFRILKSIKTFGRFKAVVIGMYSIIKQIFRWKQQITQAS